MSNLNLSIWRKIVAKGHLSSFAVSAGASILIAGSALAADLPTRKGPPVAPVYVPPPFTWTGFYVGANAGYGWANGNNNNNVFPIVGAVDLNGHTIFPTGHSSNNGGFVGGIQGGYNYQFGIGQGFVLGGEVDIDYADIFRHNNNNVFLSSFTLPQFPGTVFTPSNLAVVSHSNNNKYLGTVRLRVGYAWDRFLVYATGGLAYGGIGTSGNGFGAGFTATTAAGFVNPVNGLAGPSSAFIGGVTNSGSSTKAGWTVGAGGEYAFTNNWTFKIEYLFSQFERNHTAPGFFLPGVALAFNTSSHVNVNMVRLGVNYKFW